MAGLPYDRTPTPEPVEAPGPSTTRPSALDMALDDYESKAEPIPEHVQSLMGRMSKGKVYLLEESPAILHVDGKERVRGDSVSLPSALPREAVADSNAADSQLGCSARLA